MGIAVCHYVCISVCADLCTYMSGLIRTYMSVCISVSVLLAYVCMYIVWRVHERGWAGLGRLQPPGRSNGAAAEGEAAGFPRRRGAEPEGSLLSNFIIGVDISETGIRERELDVQGEGRREEN